MSKNRQYDQEYKLQAVKLAKEIGGGKAARELGISSNTLYGWMRKERTGHLAQQGAVSPDAAISLVDENEALRKQVRQLTKEIKRINELNEFLEEASAFFAASRLKLGKMNE